MWLVFLRSTEEEIVDDKINLQLIVQPEIGGILCIFYINVRACGIT